MSANVENSSSPMDLVKWLIAIALLAAAVVGNTMYGEESALIRAIGVVAAIAIALVLRQRQVKVAPSSRLRKKLASKYAKLFGQHAKKPHTTFIVMIATVIMALILWDWTEFYSA